MVGEGRGTKFWAQNYRARGGSAHEGGGLYMGLGGAFWYSHPPLVRPGEQCEFINAAHRAISALKYHQIKSCGVAPYVSTEFQTFKKPDLRELL